jgi:hypothetical protein
MAKDYSQLEEKHKGLENKMNSSTDEKIYYERQLQQIRGEIETLNRYKVEITA